MNCVRTAQSIL